MIRYWKECFQQSLIQDTFKLYSWGRYSAFGTEIRTLREMSTAHTEVLR